MTSSRPSWQTTSLAPASALPAVASRDPAIDVGEDLAPLRIDPTITGRTGEPDGFQVAQQVTDEWGMRRHRPMHHSANAHDAFS